ncbi:MAG: MBL fold metallo-hydrolase [Kordiimonadaceae bacterium]|nr:MBL fold metallo-hydrolase [Kordiimonadaceae bacterium]MBO6569931.1 MBL fold metallo-hydrolase [Kordiimonadaceae bacterium]MBO6965972.1 MBL fold metallo-hydrolase [Kordiimonadaceae bacterium]
MIFRQLFDHDTWTYTYLLADENSREAVIIDPVVEKMPLYTQLFKELDVKLTHAIDTHVHADHVTALGTLRETFGAKAVHGAASTATGIDRLLEDGEDLAFGKHRLRGIATPGHTDDSFSYLLSANGQDMVFTGDTLLIRGSGRTDFQNGDAGTQYDSIHNRLLTLPADTVVYPGHDYRGMTESRIGEEKRHNPRLQVANKQEYVELMDNLNLPNPKFMDVAVPANLEAGYSYATEYHI